MIRCESPHQPAPTRYCVLTTTPLVGEYIQFTTHPLMLTDGQRKSSPFNLSFAYQVVQAHTPYLCHTMHASFKSISMLVLVTSAFAPAFSTPIECALILFTIAIRLISL